MKASAIFHRLLRVVDRYITKRNANPLWRNYVLDQFHQNRNLADPKKIQKLFAIALEYSDLVQSVHENKRLLESYDITTDKDARQRKLIEKTAKRVGFELPKTYETE